MEMRGGWLHHSSSYVQGGLLATLYSAPTPYLTILVDEREESAITLLRSVMASPEGDSGETETGRGEWTG